MFVQLASIWPLRECASLAVFPASLVLEEAAVTVSAVLREPTECSLPVPANAKVGTMTLEFSFVLPAWRPVSLATEGLLSTALPVSLGIRLSGHRAGLLPAAPSMSTQGCA